MKQFLKKHATIMTRCICLLYGVTV